MNATFSLTRVLQLIRKQWIENTRLYGWSILALMGMLGLAFTFWLTTDNHFREENLYIIFIISLYLAGSVFASTSFQGLGEKTRGTYWLSFPASHLEKLVCMIFYNLVVFTLLFVACFYLVKYPAVAYAKSLVASDPMKYSFSPMIWDRNFGFGEIFPYFMYGFVAVQAFYMLGSAYFSRLSFVLSSAIGTALFLIFFVYLKTIHDNLMPDDYGWRGIYVTHEAGPAQPENYLKRYELPPLAEGTLLFLIKYAWAPVFWLITWFRLREKEI